MKKNSKLLFLVLLMTMLCGGAIRAAESADAILKNAAGKLDSAKSIVATYKLSADGQAMKGDLVVARDRFVIDAPEVKSWFDGKTQWTYSAQIGEVNVTEPDADELAQVNPFAVINSFRSRFKSKIIKTAGELRLIEMIPVDKKNNVTKVMLTINSRTLYPTKIVIYSDGASPVTIDVLSVNEGQFLPESYFRFDPKKFTGIEIIDLR